MLNDSWKGNVRADLTKDLRKVPETLLEFLPES